MIFCETVRVSELLISNDKIKSVDAFGLCIDSEEGTHLNKPDQHWLLLKATK